MNVELWLLGLALLVTGGFAMLIRIGLEDTLVLANASLRRVRRQRLSWLTPRRAVTTESEIAPQSRRLILIGLGAGIVLGITWLSSPLIAIWFVVWGAGAGWVVRVGRPVHGQDLRELEVFISTLRSIFSAGQSITNALDIAAQNLEAGLLQQTVAEAVRRYRSEPDLGVALQVLRTLRWPVVTRLALVLEQVGRANPETVERALSDLEGRVRVSRRLRDRANTVLTVSRLTLRVLQGANLLALVAVTMLPTWHQFYDAHPFGLMAATGMVLAGSAYFVLEMNRLEHNAQ